MKTITIYLQPVLLTAIFFIFYLLMPAFCTAQTPLFYGVTSIGGTSGGGTLFSFNMAGNAENVVADFQGNAVGGETPCGTPVYNPGNGLLYGMTTSGSNGGANAGIIFSFNPVNGNTENVWNFGGDTDGAGPYGSLVYYAGNSLFYGLTSAGGSHSLGTIFSFNPADNTEKVLWSFEGSPDASNPDGSLVFDTANGLFYGMTARSIFSFNPTDNTEKVLYTFGAQPDGSGATGDLSYDPQNKLFYGMTLDGGANAYGTIISFNPSNNSEHVVWSFGSGTDGISPHGDLVYNSTQGLFYGMTGGGGVNSIVQGTIISFNPANDSEKVVWSFAGGPSDGAEPLGSLVYNPGDGLYYATTYNGGSNGDMYLGYGTIINFNPLNNAVQVLWNFGAGVGGPNPDGAGPKGSLVLYSGPTAVNNVNTSPSISVYPNPTNGKINITGLSQGQTVELYNDLGQRINSIKAQDAMLQLDVSPVANGIYLVQVLNDDGTIAGGSKAVKTN